MSNAESDRARARALQAGVTAAIALTCPYHFKEPARKLFESVFALIFSMLDRIEKLEKDRQP